MPLSRGARALLALTGLGILRDTPPTRSALVDAVNTAVPKAP